MAKSNGGPAPSASEAPWGGNANRRETAEADPFAPESITAVGSKLPDRIILYAPEKWGKSSFAAQAEGAVFLMSRGEDGILTLKRTGQVNKEVQHYPRPCETWAEATRALLALAAKGPRPKTLVLDVLNGFGQMLAEQVCSTAFNGNWKLFNQFGGIEGWKNCLPEWEKFLAQLDRLRQLGTCIVCLAHASVERVPNPNGLDYDRWQPAMDRKSLWPMTQRWADIIVFGGYEMFVEKDDKKNERATKGKATGGQRRLYCEPTPTVAAGSRHGLEAEIECGESAAQAWAAFQAALKGE